MKILADLATHEIKLKYPKERTFFGHRIRGRRYQTRRLNVCTQIFRSKILHLVLCWSMFCTVKVRVPTTWHYCVNVAETHSCLEHNLFETLLPMHVRRITLTIWTALFLQSKISRFGVHRFPSGLPCFKKYLTGTTTGLPRFSIHHLQLPLCLLFSIFDTSSLRLPFVCERIWLL